MRRSGDAPALEPVQPCKAALGEGAESGEGDEATISPAPPPGITGADSAPLLHIFILANEANRNPLWRTVLC